MRTVIRLVLMVFPLFSLLDAKGQGSASFWEQVYDLDLGHDREYQIQPQKYRAFNLEMEEMRSWLENRIFESDNPCDAYLQLPAPQGEMKTFYIKETPVLLPPLNRKYPTLRTYTGWATDNRSQLLKLDITPHGLHAMVLAGGDTWFIDPMFREDDLHYFSYFKKDFAAPEFPFHCSFEAISKGPRPGSPKSTDGSGDCQLRTYRLALAATAEYTSFQGGVENALAAQVTTINRVNAIYERDLAITLKFIGNNDTLLYTDPQTDPYNNGSSSIMIFQNQKNLDTVIGGTNYDIGHVFFQAQSGDGQANPGVCNAEAKARGVTGSPNPVGDPFDIDFVAHEMGHQFGATHTLNSCHLSPSVDSTAFEPGSGSSVMSYAGICKPNVQAHTDGYFHAASIKQIFDFVTQPGHNCPVLTPLDNSPPRITVKQKEYFIPAATPFVLHAFGEDPDRDSLTYCWEGYDNEIIDMPPSSNAGKGPAFRSWPPRPESVRYFPNLADLSSGVLTEWEVLSTVSRKLNFKVTVRDNSVPGGCSAVESVQITVVGEAGPFTLTQPNDANTVWQPGKTEAVKWEVAGTDKHGLMCTLVDILLSTDGGLTYPNILLAGTPNTGCAEVIVPQITTSQARIMVMGTYHIFFDISDHNYTLQP